MPRYIAKLSMSNVVIAHESQVVNDSLGTVHGVAYPLLSRASNEEVNGYE
jgi:hypothetical protein